MICLTDKNDKYHLIHKCPAIFCFLGWYTTCNLKDNVDLCNVLYKWVHVLSFQSRRFLGFFWKIVDSIPSRVQPDFFFFDIVFKLNNEYSILLVMRRCWWCLFTKYLHENPKLHTVQKVQDKNILTSKRVSVSWKLSTWKLSLSWPVVGSRLSRWFWERMSTYNNHVSDWRWCRPWNCNVEMVVIVVQGSSLLILLQVCWQFCRTSKAWC